jgi:hypothetical protein
VSTCVTHADLSPEGGVSRLVQTAIFAPRGLYGALYLYALYPLQARIFSDLARAIAAEAEAAAPRPVIFRVADVHTRKIMCCFTPTVSAPSASH